VVPGGYVAFHDYGKPDFPGVTSFVDEIVEGGYWQPVQRAAGLIILEKPEQPGNPPTMTNPFFEVLLRAIHRLQRPATSQTSISKRNVRLENWEQNHVRERSRIGGTRSLVAENVNSGDIILAAGLDRSQLAELSNWTIWIFPEQETYLDGSLLHSDDTTLIAQLEVRRAEGATHLLIVGDGLPWLEAHTAFRNHLDTSHFLVSDTKEPKATARCVIYELFPISLGAGLEAHRGLGSEVQGLVADVCAQARESMIGRMSNSRLRTNG
jgi:hypothetical protein